jgi:hypothetical protein
MKFRIVKLIHNVGDLKYENGRFTIEYVIERKNWLGKWKEIFNTELEPKRISHKSYEDAEAYMIANYMGHGICKKVGDEYEYTGYTYYV